MTFEDGFTPEVEHYEVCLQLCVQPACNPTNSANENMCTFALDSQVASACNLANLPPALQTSYPRSPLRFLRPLICRACLHQEPESREFPSS